METARTATLAASVVLMGLIAGLFYAYSMSGLPGLARSSDRTFVEAMQNINRAILNGWFALIFGGSLVVTAVAGAPFSRRRRSPHCRGSSPGWCSTSPYWSSPVSSTSPPSARSSVR